MTENGKEKHLIPIAGSGPRLDAVFAPLVRPARGRNAARHICAFFCALSCLFFITVVFLLSLSLLRRMEGQENLLRLAERAFSGGACFTVTETLSAEDRLPFPEGAAKSPEETVSGEAVQQPAAQQAEESTPAAPQEYRIADADLSCGDIYALFNETDYAPDTKALLNAPLPFPSFSTWSAEYSPDEPYILILHTHGTEAYAPEGSSTYRKTDSFRSGDITRNVVAVGDVMAQTFAAAGIPVMHCTEMFDEESYQNSYSRASAAIRTILSEHPSIQIVLDVHRDSVIRSDFTKLRPVTEFDGERTAQFMIVAGTDFKGADFPGWQDNLNFALKIQSNLHGRCRTFARAINLRGAGFNEHYRSGSLLLEVGSCGNTLEEARRAGAAAAIAIADVVTNGGCFLEISDILP
ncbi:MAG: stage II sporulation protein P [Eubacteriales bacterium]